ACSPGSPATARDAAGRVGEAWFAARRAGERETKEACGASFLLRHAVDRRSVLRREIALRGRLDLLRRHGVVERDDFVDPLRVVAEERERGQEVRLPERRLELAVVVRAEAHLRRVELLLR